MEDQNEHIARLVKKLQRLIKSYEQLQQEYARQEAKLIDSANKLEDSIKNMDQLREQNLILKTSLTIMPEEDRKALDLKLNKYVKAIDKTIALLSQ